MIALGAAVGFGISIAMMKSLTRTESTLAIIFWMLVVQSVAGFFPALYVWVWPSAYAWGWIVVIAFCGTFSHYCMARAMLYADATVVLPMDFLRVPLTAAAGWLIYSERLDMFTVLGAALILTGNLLNLKAADPVPARARSLIARRWCRRLATDYSAVAVIQITQYREAACILRRSRSTARQNLGIGQIFVARCAVFSCSLAPALQSESLDSIGGFQMRYLTVILSLICMVFTAHAAKADRRVAFVVGNGAYKNVARFPTRRSTPSRWRACFAMSASRSSKAPTSPATR